MPFIKPDCILRDYVLSLMTEQINHPLSKVQRSLVGYSPWGHRELDKTEWLTYTHTHTHTHTQPLIKELYFVKTKVALSNTMLLSKRKFTSFNQKDNKHHKNFKCKKNFFSMNNICSFKKMLNISVKFLVSFSHSVPASTLITNRNLVSFFLLRKK